MSVFEKITSVQKYAIAGVLFGIMFPMMALGIDSFHKGVPISFRGIIELHTINPLHYIIDMAPAILGLVSYLIGRRVVVKENKLIETMNEEIKVRNMAANFASELAKGNYNNECLDVSLGDTLCKALNTLQNSLSENDQDHNMRKMEDERQNWMNKGLSHLNNVLRSESENLEKLSYAFIKELIRYLEINQGGVYIVKEENQRKYLYQSACFAYDRQKFNEKEIEWGEGLIGACILEKETIYRSKVPRNYIDITSGLGDSAPSSLLIVPIKHYEEIYGAVEIAAFETFEPHEITFVEKVCESFGAAISAVLINSKNALLLAESKKVQEELIENEEIMRTEMEQAIADKEKMESEIQNLTQQVSHLKEEVNRLRDEKEG